MDKGELELLLLQESKYIFYYTLYVYHKYL